jgi:hypothetical protein
LEKKAVAFTVLAAVVLIFALNVVYVLDVRAEAYAVDWVNHRVEVLYNGYIFINDTFKISGIVPDSFLMGFPYQYGSHVLRCVAYNPSNPAQKYNVAVDVPLENYVGFFGVNVSLTPKPEDGIFTVGFVLSNSLLRQDAQNTSLYTLDFPAFPSLIVNASSCNASVILPSDAKYVSGTIAAFNYLTNEELPRLTYQPSNVTFLLTTEGIQLFTVEEFKREVVIGGMGEIAVSDSYYIKNQSPKQITSVGVFLLPNASNLAVKDEFGRKGGTTTLADAETNRYEISLTLPVEIGKSTRFIVEYTLPKNYIQKSETDNAELSLKLFPYVNYYIEEAWVTFTLPEGAKITNLSFENSSADMTYGTIRDVFQEKITANKHGVFFLDSLTMKVAYRYNLLWLSFRPTLWAWALATFGCAVIAIWRRPKAPAVPVAVPTVVAVKLSPEMIRSFVESYEEKRKTVTEMKSLETAVRKGRIPRRRYKVQRKTLETRLGTLNRNLDDLKLKLRSAGGKYADLMRQLEVAETEINEVEANIRSIEMRHRRGELTLEAYRRLLADYERRREKAETTVNGILIRLREEIR